jgi:hypothetical protein
LPLPLYNWICPPLHPILQTSVNPVEEEEGTPPPRPIIL